MLQAQALNRCNSFPLQSSFPVKRQHFSHIFNQRIEHRFRRGELTPFPTSPLTPRSAAPPPGPGRAGTGRRRGPGRSPRRRRRRARRRSGSCGGRRAPRSPPWPPSCGRSCTPATGRGSPRKRHGQILRILPDRANAVLCGKSRYCIASVTHQANSLLPWSSLQPPFCYLTSTSH